MAEEQSAAQSDTSLYGEDGSLKVLKLYSSILYIFEPLFLFLLWWLVIMIFLFFFLLLARCFLLYASFVPGARNAFNDISLNYLYKKKVLKFSFLC
jgi:hypothetical protein